MKRAIFQAAFCLFALLSPIAASAQNIVPLDQWRATSTPAAGITQRIFGRSLILSGLSDGCLTITSFVVGSQECGSGGGGGSSFSTTSADYWKTQRNFFSTTSADHWKGVNNFWSTTSASFWASLGLGFSTTSTDAWEATKARWSTTSSDYWKTQNNFWSTTSANAWSALGLGWSTTSADNYVSLINKGYFFSTTSADAWKAERSFWSTTSASFWSSLGLGHSTTSTNYLLNASSTQSLPLCGTGQIPEWSGTRWNCGDDDTGGGGGPSFGKTWEIASGALSPTTTIGIGVYSSSTIGDGIDGLTTFGNATTTGTAYISGTTSIGTTLTTTRFNLMGPPGLGVNLIRVASSTGSAADDLMRLSAGGVLRVIGGQFISTQAGAQNVLVQTIDDSATLGPSISYVRTSTSPAANDQLGNFLFYGSDSTLVTTQIGGFVTSWLDPTNGSETSRVLIGAMYDGAYANSLTVLGNGITVTGGATTTRGATSTALAVTSIPNLACVGTNSTGGFITGTCPGTIPGQTWEISSGALSPTTTIGVGIYASSTIGSGTAFGGLTIYGGATTTGNLIGQAAINFGDATSLEIPNGSGPTVDAIGEMAFDTTDNQILFGTSTNAAYPAVIPTIQPLWKTTIASTSAAWFSGGRVPLPELRDGVVIKEIHCSAIGGTSVVINLSNGAGSADTETVTCDTNGQSDADITTNNTVAALATSSLEIGTITGSVNWLTFSVWGSITRE